VAPRKPSGPGEGAPGRERGRTRTPRPSSGLPAADGDAPLQELERDALSVFLFVGLTPDETRALVKELELQIPGFRTDALSDVQRCDVLADEIRARPEVRRRVGELLRLAFGGVAFPVTALDVAAADDLLAVGGSDHGLTLALWRVLADPSAEVRARAVPVLEQLAEDYYGPVPAGEEREEAGAGRLDGEARARVRVQELEKELARAEERVESARRKGEEQREKLQEWLREARARAAQAVDEGARAREAAGAAQTARERAEAALAAAQATDAAAEAQRARAAVRELEGKIAGLEARIERQGAREAELSTTVEQLEARGRAAVDAPAAPEPHPEEPEEAPATWLRPVYTREFYDSLEGWDRRIQRAAFKQANLLAQDHRHPSLRALPLEGLPGYYRVRVATDVRLLYRRGERQNEIEILSLIDREDLDRYVRQAKTR
jgi:DNA repair exonuclease SbcCD ATPase subunit